VTTHGQVWQFSPLALHRVAAQFGNIPAGLLIKLIVPTRVVMNTGTVCYGRFAVGTAADFVLADDEDLTTWVLAAPVSVNGLDADA
jgi:hypothetical protein